MPEPVRHDQRYMPGLDGLRAVAVLAVIAYHLGFGWAPGGLLGVGVFFTLSGYLITDILLTGPLSGRGRLRDFWFARARRLLPALFVMLAGVSRVVFVTVHLPPSYSWSASVNEVLQEGVARYPQDHLADFNKLAEAHPSWFGADGVHMPIGGPGAQAMASLIKSQI